MKYLRMVALVAVLLALLASGAVAKGLSTHRGLDRSFGHGGISTAFAAADAYPIYGFTVAADGRVYVLAGSTLLAFHSNGKIAGGFGEGGQMTVAPAVGEGGPNGLAVDSRGRVLVTGSAFLSSQNAYVGYVIRFHRNGARDLGYGNGGEVDTDFGLPPTTGPAGRSVYAVSIFVDGHNRPVIGGSFGKGTETCGIIYGKGPAPFVGRLTATGAIDKTFAGSGHATLKGLGRVESLARNPAGGLAVFSRECPSPPRLETRGPAFSAFTERGEASPGAEEVGLGFSYASPLIDPAGRILMIESPPPAGEGASALVRDLPNGDYDLSFGRHGRVVLRGGLKRASALAVDAQSRPIISETAKRIELRRFLPDGKLDMGFGPKGRLTAKGDEPSAIALDARGRIYTVSLAHDSSQTTVEVARFLPAG